MRISDWSSDVCSSDLIGDVALEPDRARLALAHAKALARRLLLELDERRGGRIGQVRHAIGPADMDQITFDRRHRARRLVRRIDAGQDRKSTRLNSSH